MKNTINLHVRDWMINTTNRITERQIRNFVCHELNIKNWHIEKVEISKCTIVKISLNSIVKGSVIIKYNELGYPFIYRIQFHFEGGVKDLKPLCQYLTNYDICE